MPPSLRARPVCRRGLGAGVARRKTSSRPGLRSSSHYPLGNCVGGEPETCFPPDSTRARFLIAARRTVPGSCRRPVMTPAGGTGDICQPPSVFRGGGNVAPVAALLSPVARDYPSRVLGNPSEPPHYGCSIKERRTIAPPARRGSLFFGNVSAYFEWLPVRAHQRACKLLMFEYCPPASRQAVPIPPDGSSRGQKTRKLSPKVASPGR